MRFLSYFILFILLFSGCENSHDLKNLAKKLEDEKKQSIKNVSVEKKVPSKEPEKKVKVLVNKEPEKKEIKKAITDLNLTTLFDKTISLKFSEDGISFKNYPNKIVILDVFTTWCPPCLESIPHMIKLQKKYKKSLQIIGVLHEDKIKKSFALAFKKKHHINYPLTIGKNNFVLTENWGGVSGYPTIIIFDKSGKYFNHYNGSPPFEMLQSDIKKILRKR